ncbi:hypothetical protein XELAEV_18028252mg [Xenopus laevis]|uniref:Uncharacterized protein n=1 Tax=Xenopus laevis TaxID=8355 RepID=A0A974CZC8_XENLA|nr:hypothetical protein XELAEV_18028252mg [Xenopus laevis]
MPEYNNRMFLSTPSFTQAHLVLLNTPPSYHVLDCSAQIRTCDITNTFYEQIMFLLEHSQNGENLLHLERQGRHTQTSHKRIDFAFKHKGDLAV